MEVQVLQVEGAPGDAIISARAGTAPRYQARASELASGKAPLRLGAATGGARDGLVRFHLLQPLGAARVVLRPEADGQTCTVPLAGGDASVTFAVTAATADPARPVTAESEVGGVGALLQPPFTPPGTPRNAADAYMNEHRLLPLMRALLRTVVRERPEEPFNFLAEQFHDEVLFGSKSEPTEYPSLGARAGEFEVKVLEIQGAPEGAVLSILAWKSRRQFPVALLGAGSESCRFAAGPAGLNPFRLDLLRPLGGASVALEAPEASESATRTVAIAGTKASVVLKLSRLDLEKPAAGNEGDADGWYPLPQHDPKHFQAAVESAKEYLDGNGILTAMEEFLRELLEEKPPDPMARIAEWIRVNASYRAAKAEVDAPEAAGPPAQAADAPASGPGRPPSSAQLLETAMIQVAAEGILNASDWDSVDELASESAHPPGAWAGAPSFAGDAHFPFVSYPTHPTHALATAPATTHLPVTLPPPHPSSPSPALGGVGPYFGGGLAHPLLGQPPYHSPQAAAGIAGLPFSTSSAAVAGQPTATTAVHVPITPAQEDSKAPVKSAAPPASASAKAEVTPAVADVPHGVDDGGSEAVSDLEQFMPVPAARQGFTEFTPRLSAFTPPSTAQREQELSAAASTMQGQLPPFAVSSGTGTLLPGSLASAAGVAGSVSFASAAPMEEQPQGLTPTPAPISTAGAGAGVGVVAAGFTPRLSDFVPTLTPAQAPAVTAVAAGASAPLVDSHATAASPSRPPRFDHANVNTSMAMSMSAPPTPQSTEALPVPEPGPGAAVVYSSQLDEFLPSGQPADGPPRVPGPAAAPAPEVVYGAGSQQASDDTPRLSDFIPSTSARAGAGAGAGTGAGLVFTPRLSGFLPSAWATETKTERQMETETGRQSKNSPPAAVSAPAAAAAANANAMLGGPTSTSSSRGAEAQPELAVSSLELESTAPPWSAGLGLGLDTESQLAELLPPQPA